MKTIGITGTGFIVRTAHLPGLAACKNLLVKGFHDIDINAAKAAKQRYLTLLAKAKNPVLDVAVKETKTYDDLSTMLDDVDAVDICTPPKHHVMALGLAVERAKHVACEKPLARNWWALEANPSIGKGIKAKKLAFQLHTQAIWNPLIEAGRDAVQSGIIGEIEKIRVLHQTADPKHAMNLASLWDKHHAGGGALMDIGPHAYSVMWYWLGTRWTPVATEAKLLKATVPVRTIASIPNTRITVEDDAHIIIAWRDKKGKEITGDLEATWNQKDWCDGDVGTNLEPTLYYEVHGTKGTLTFPNIVPSNSKPTSLEVGFNVMAADGSKSFLGHPIPMKRIEESIFFEELESAITSGGPTRNNFKFSEDMLAVFGAAYLSKKNGGVRTTLDEFKRFARDNATPDAPVEHQVSAIIDALQ
nr:Gfo/Idh/MocA family oxidoreductase [Candidatus Sigynarchaeota archaeon]